MDPTILLGLDIPPRATPTSRYTPLDRPPWLLALERDPEAWMRRLFPAYVSNRVGVPVPFAEHHNELWRWVMALEPGQRAPALFAIWPRGGGKSTHTEAGVVHIGARGVRRFVLYVSATQDQADAHVNAIASMLESRAIEELYPALGQRALSKFGKPRGWSRDRLRTASGFTVEGYGLRSGMRGIKIDEVRPDLIIFDDIDQRDDSPTEVQQKIDLISTSILPAGSPDRVVVGVQNLIHDNSIFSQVANGTADLLRDRIVSGPVPAVRDLIHTRLADGRVRFTGGTPSWVGLDLAQCEFQANESLDGFLRECQHEVDAPAGGMFDAVQYRRVDKPPVQLVRVVVTVDPAVTNRDSSDAHGIQVDGLGNDYRIYRLFSWEQRSSPLNSIRMAMLKAVEYGAERIIIETDQGGDTWQDTYHRAWLSLIDDGEVPPKTPRPHMREEKAGITQMSKAARAAPMLADYQGGRIVHCTDNGTFQVLEKALRRFPKTKPYDLVDSAAWGWKYLSKFRPQNYSQHARVTVAEPVRSRVSW